MQKVEKKILAAVFVMVVIPLLVHIAIVENGLEGIVWFSGNPSEVDFFLVWKSYVIVGIAIVMAMILFVDIIRKNDGIALISANYTVIMIQFTARYVK